MLFLRFLLLLASFGLVACAAGMVLYDIYLTFELDRILRRSPNAAATPEAGQSPPVPALPRPRRRIRVDTAAMLVATGAAMGVAGEGIVVVPDGRAGAIVSQIYGVLPKTLYPGTHLIFPGIDRVETYDIRDQVFATAAAETAKEKHEVLTIDAKEGLTIGLGVTVRYRIDPRRVDYVQANDPQPIEQEIVEPVVTSNFRSLGPNYTVREIFASKREEFRQRAAQAITARLAQDAIVVKEVLIGRIELPEEYAQGLEGLLLKEQQDDQTDIEAEIEGKRVKIASAQAEQAKVRQIKRAEADAQQQVILAKAQSDAMQYTLPLKQKQIEQTRLEAEAAKEATLQNADAQAQAKVIDSKAEQQRMELLAEAAAQDKITESKAEQQSELLLADAEADRIRVTGKAEGERMEVEAAALAKNPLLIQKEIAERLSDKIQIMMVPADGQFFFANDALKSAAGVSLVSPGPRGSTK